MARSRPRWVGFVLVLSVAMTSIPLALIVTPMQQVSGAGQTIQVGVAEPSLSLSGPAELDLFGQRLESKETFIGPVRPRLRLTRISLSQQLAQFATGSGPSRSAKSLEDALVSGWMRYFYWQIACVAVIALVLLGAIGGWRRQSRKGTIGLIMIGLLVTEAINLGAIMVTAYTASGKLGQVHSLESLVGSAPDLVMPHRPSGRSSVANKVVVIGDSTAAAIGNRPLPHPSKFDAACERSVDSYAHDLVNANGWSVTNLACSRASIAAGLLGPQNASNLSIPPQIGNTAVTQASTVIVSVGANDIQWSNLLKICAVSTSCQNGAEQAYFQQLVSSFSTDYLRLLSTLQLLPQHPRVLINLYYDPIAGRGQCLFRPGITESKQRVIESRLSALNSILSSGADAAGFLTAKPNYNGHGLCSEDPWVQGLKASAPLHPTAAGELAIALVDTEALAAR
ncbi:MAG: hypothetical protein NVS3B21_18700 [Acidimicrobiales bacterium]